MTRDDIIRMAREAGGYPTTQTDRALLLFSESHLERLARLIEKHLSYDGIHTCHDQCQRPVCVAIREAVEREREACAKVCDGIRYSGYCPPEDGGAPRYYNDAAEECADTIRARGRA
jgi:hypothetical protein